MDPADHIFSWRGFNDLLSLRWSWGPPPDTILGLSENVGLIFPIIAI